MIAALFVEPGGVYFGLPHVDPWAPPRDAQEYVGPYPVIAHPPCERWCQLAPVNQARYGIKIGDDGGTFAAALAAVRRWGGVLEHPAMTFAFSAHGLPRPLPAGWIRTPCGGWICQIEQGSYGHPARKATWLYAFGTETPSMKWGKGPPPTAWISTDRPRSLLAQRGVGQLSRGTSARTGPEFRDLLISIAESANVKSR